MFRTKARKKRHRFREVIMAQGNTKDNEILPASGEDKHHLGVTILELKFSSCRYIIGYEENAGTIFCGEVIHRISYCANHYSACYIPAPKKLKATEEESHRQRRP